MYDNKEEVLDLSKTSTIKAEEQFAAKYMAWRLATNFTQTKVEPKSPSPVSQCCDDSDAKVSPGTTPSPGYNNNLSFDYAETPTPRRQRTPSGKPVIKDDSYLERRRKNNQAAKKSRDAKRQREHNMRNQLVILQHENEALRLALNSCVCRSMNKRPFPQTPFDFASQYRESQFLPMISNLRG